MPEGGSRCTSDPSGRLSHTAGDPRRSDEKREGAESRAAGTNLSEVLPAGDYSGTARALKDKKRSRLDFAFNENGGTCRLPESGDGPPPIDDPEVCRYHLILEYGIYDRGGDLVTFRLPDSRVRLWDYQQELNPETGILDPIATGRCRGRGGRGRPRARRVAAGAPGSSVG